MKRTVTRAAGLIIVLALGTFGAAGCGGSDGGSSSQPSAEEWAGDVCSSLKTWSDSVKSATTSLQGNVTADSLKSAGEDVENATKTLVDDLKGLGTPDTESGDKAKETVDNLSDELDQDANKIDSALKEAKGASGVLDAVSVVTSTLSTMAGQFQTALSNLEQLDPKGELEDAFSSSDSCKSLTSSSS
jgi:hypothetical protein